MCGEVCVEGRCVWGGVCGGGVCGKVCVREGVFNPPRNAVNTFNMLLYF